LSYPKDDRLSVFYQQSGKRGEADFPKTLVNKDGSLRIFTTASLRQEFGVSVCDQALDLVQGTIGFQIWGVPPGARDYVKGMKSGDIVLLIGHLSQHNLQDGRFFYAGRVAYILPEEDLTFSRKLWGDTGFPLIFFLQGSLIDYTWCAFARDFRFKENYYIAGHIVRIPTERMRLSTFGAQAAFAERLGIDIASLRRTHGRTN